MLGEYIIQFEGLKEGIHFFEFNLDNKFFEEFDCFEFNKSSFKIDLKFEKKSTMMLLNFEFSGSFVVPCDRCLDDVEMSVEGNEDLIVKFGNDAYDQTEEILVLADNEYEINVAENIYEFIMVNMPQKRVHPEELCNQDVVKELKKIVQKEDDNMDPRWSTLKDINLEK